MEYCNFQYTGDAAYNNLSSPIIGPVNVPFVISPLEAVTTGVTYYYYQVTVMVNYTFRIVIRSRKSFINTVTEDEQTPKTITNHISTFPTSLPPVFHIVGGVSGTLLVAFTISIIIIIMLICKGKCSIPSLLMQTRYSAWCMHLYYMEALYTEIEAVLNTHFDSQR